MELRFLSFCGLIAPILFAFMTVLGGAIRPGYSHISKTVSELFSPGSPNKLLLDILHTVYALLVTLFGVGLLQFFNRVKQSSRFGKLGASLYIAMGCLSVAIATLFPQDAWGSPPTFPGQMHIYLSGMIGFLSLISMLLIGIWFKRAKIFPGFGTYTFITIGLCVISASFFLANAGSSIWGLTERIAILIGFLWVFRLALWIFLRERKAN